MSVVTLTSRRKRPLRPLVEAAIQNELRLLQSGIKRTEQRLQDFEAEYGFSSDEFISRYENDELAETLDFAEWIGEYRLLERLHDKAKTLQEVQIAS